MHDLRADRHGRRTGNVFILPDNEQIGHAIERLQKVREQIGLRKQHDVLEHAAGCKIPFHKHAFFLNDSALIINSTAVAKSTTKRFFNVEGSAPRALSRLFSARLRIPTA